MPKKVLATERQIAEVVSIFSNISKKRMREILESGLLLDLREGAVLEASRNKIRKLLNLPPLHILKILEDVQVSIGEEPFVAKDKFTEEGASAGIISMNDVFFECFLSGDGKIESRKDIGILRQSILSEDASTKEIIFAIDSRGNNEITTLTEIFALLIRQKNGEHGTLLVNGYPNIFFVEDICGLCRVVYCSWEKGWEINAKDPALSPGWKKGCYVFYRYVVNET